MVKRSKLLTSAENYCIILENCYLDERTMPWNSNPSWCPISREADSMPIEQCEGPDRHWWLTVLPPYFINKGDPQQNVQNHCALMVDSSSAAAHRRYLVLT